MLDSFERRLAAAPERTPARVRPWGFAFALPGWWLLEVSEGERRSKSWHHMV